MAIAGIGQVGDPVGAASSAAGEDPDPDRLQPPRPLRR
jgi:hypothetical protein